MISLIRRKPKAERPQMFEVTFEASGRSYTYNRTPSEFQALMKERYLLRSELPHKVFTIRNGERTEIIFTI